MDKQSNNVVGGAEIRYRCTRGTVLAVRKTETSMLAPKAVPTTASIVARAAIVSQQQVTGKGATSTQAYRRPFPRKDAEVGSSRLKNFPLRTPCLMFCDVAWSLRHTGSMSDTTSPDASAGSAASHGLGIHE